MILIFYFKRAIVAARLERSSFCDEERRAKKREWKAEIAAQIKFKLAIRLSQKLPKNLF